MKVEFFFFNKLLIVNQDFDDQMIRQVSFNTVKLGYNELGYNEHSVITNRFLSQTDHFSTQINPVIIKYLFISIW